MSLPAIETFLKQRIGFDPSSTGSRTIERLVRQRMTALKMLDSDSYLKLLQQSSQEQEELFELVVVPETWFFRDKEPFVFLQHYIVSKWLPSNKNHTLSVLSIPCSSGEEPYSIAIALLEAGLKSEQFQIDAVDLSRKALAKAKKGIYGKNSFRHPALAFLKRYFIQAEDGMVIVPALRETINFRRGNILEDALYNSSCHYDVIFCRNVLIYFDKQAKEHVLKKLDGILEKEGILFLGYAETMQKLLKNYISIPYQGAFAYKKIVRQAQHTSMKHDALPLQAKKSTSGSFLQKKIKSTATVRKEHTSVTTQQRVAAPIISARDELLQKARKLADQGQLAEASILCEQFLKEHGPEAPAYYLLGVICESKGDTVRAEDCLHKTIYLEPDNYDAILHLALILEKNNKTDKAKILRQRALRLQSIRTT